MTRRHGGHPGRADVPPALHPGGTIGILSGDLSRYTDFAISLMHTQAPPGTRMVWTKGVDIVGNMNDMRRRMVGDWLWILGDDHVFQPDTLLRLLDHDVDVVVPLCLKRTPPYDPVVYAAQDDDGMYVATTDLGEPGLVEIHACGSAGMLVRAHVLDAIPDPVFASDGGLNEDLTLCRKIREAGFKIHVDTATTIGHISQVSVWPMYVDGEWQIGLNAGNGEVFPIRRQIARETVAA